MCNLYNPAGPQKISMAHAVAAPLGAYGSTIGPLQPGPIVVPGRALLAQWGLIPPHSPTRRPATPDGKPLSTNNARRERLASAPTYRGPWLRGQRCIIPAESFDEPYWGTGKNIWWRFWRADGAPWALAGVWAEWTDPHTGEVVPSFTMITQNCDSHPVLRLMHKPDPRLPDNGQDKRTVVALEPADWDTWLHGTVAQADALIRLTPPESFRHAAVDPAKQLEIGFGH